MTDDDRLAELFRTAASDPDAPPAGFGHADVVSASHRITARRRSAVVAAAVAVFALVGVGAVVILPAERPTASTAAAPAAPDRAGRAESGPDAAAAPNAAAGPDAARVPDPAAAPEGGPGPGDAAGRSPLGPGTGACADRQDPQLRAYLEQVLPEVVGAPAAADTDDCRPGGQRYVTVEVQEGAARGLFAVSYLPPGTAVDPTAGSVSAPTASGGTVVVRTVPVGGTVAPFQSRLPEVAASLAPKL